MSVVIDIPLQLKSAHPFCMTLWSCRRPRHTADISRSSDARRKAREQCPRPPPPRIGGPKSEGRKREHLSYNNRRKSHLTLALALARSVFRSAIERTRYLALPYRRESGRDRPIYRTNFRMRKRKRRESPGGGMPAVFQVTSCRTVQGWMMPYSFSGHRRYAYVW